MRVCFCEPNADIEPEGGLFIWMKMPEKIDIIKMNNQAANQGIMLAPGNLFKLHQERSQWMPFNVASCNQPFHLPFLKKSLISGNKN